MSVLAVIPCLNEASHLRALIEQMLSDDAIDLLVVADAGSDDGSREIVLEHMTRSKRLRLLDNPARIQSAGINRAVALFGDGYEWLLRIDAHCVYPDCYAHKLLEAAERKNATAVVVPMLTIGRERFQIAAAAAQNSVLGNGGSAHRHGSTGEFVDHGHHALMRMDLFKAIGGYCEAMPWNEDAELDYRQTARGGRIWLEPSATITYFPRSTPRALWRQYFRYGIGRARNMRRHRMRPRLRQMAPLAVPLAIAALPLSLVHWVFAAPAAAWLAICLFVGLWIGLRAGERWALLAGLAAAIMHLGWSLGFLSEWIGRSKGREPRYGFSTSP